MKKNHLCVVKNAHRNYWYIEIKQNTCMLGLVNVVHLLANFVHKKELSICAW